jgi:hypothetical protein
MGANLPKVHRALGVRNPVIRILVLTGFLLFVAVVIFRGQQDGVRNAIVRTAKAAQHTITNHGYESENDRAAEVRLTDLSSQNGKVLAHGNASGNAMDCQCNVQHLAELQQKYGLQTNFHYLRRYVKLERHDIERESVTKLAAPLLNGKFKQADIGKGTCDETCHEPLVVPVPESPFPTTVDASDFLFAVSTTYERLNDPKTSPIDDWSYWMTNGKGISNGAKLMLMLLDASKSELAEVRSSLASIGIDADVKHSDSKLEMAVRYLTLVPTMYNHSARKTRKWLVLCDDDTFFPYMHSLVDRFKRYDASEPLYIGTLSEDVSAVERHGSQAFGGAGVFLSVSMAKLVADNYKECKNEDAVNRANTGFGPQGDILLKNCIYDHSSYRLTTLRDLWQLDLYGDPSGFYESGIKPLSIHHYRSWHLAHPFDATKLSHICGEDCFLQRFRTSDNFVISNGFSVAQYPRGIDFDLNQFERTFAPSAPDRGWDLDFMLGPQRQSLVKTGRKWSWDMQEAFVDRESGAVTQVYVRKADDWRWSNADEKPMGGRDGVIELVWIV